MNALTTVRQRSRNATLRRQRAARSESHRQDLVAFATHLAQEHELATDHHSRRNIGQVFTPPSVCRFMAEGLGSIGQTYRLLDPGAGTGSLTAAVCERVLQYQARHHLSAVLFETDKSVLPYLHRCIEQCQQSLRHAGHELDFTIRAEDFVLSRAQSSLFDDACRPEFDGVVMNPPYFKIAKDSAHARTMTDVVHGQPNIYALFMAVGAEMLLPGGRFVAITPRSYCNGLYFREFRRWFFKHMQLSQLHLFESRTATFLESQVLQESLITVATRRQPDGLGAPRVIISTSNGRDLAEVRKYEYPASAIVDDSAGDSVIRVPVEPTDAAIMEAVESWSATFAERGLQISTGPVVLFRAKEHLLANADSNDAVPLLSAHNVRVFETVWPLAKGEKPIAFRDCPESKSQVLPSRNYVLVRRFSPKEEHRRLTASCYLPSRQERKRPVALENHINYIYLRDRELTETETVGLAAVINSALLDRYFRLISGNTQINATEIRTMPFPDLKAIARIGERVRKLNNFPADQVERIVLTELQINGALSRELLGAAS